MSAIHHVAITVTNLETSIAFYEKLGFKVLFKKDTPEKQKRLALLGKDDLKLEMFYFENQADDPTSRDTIGNNVKEVGQKHFALNVSSITKTKDDMESIGIPLASKPDIGDAGYHYFFVRDPDGIWIEYVQDDKY